MANEKRLIDVNDLHAFLEVVRQDCLEENTFSSYFAAKVIETIQDEYLAKAPTVDAVPVDEIRVDFEQLCIVNQEAVLNVSICGKPNEVKIPFSKEVAEVVHGRWEDEYDGKYANPRYRCSACKEKALYKFKKNGLDQWVEVQALTPCCPICGAKMDGDGK